jgi:hypothetical protein
LRICKQTRIAVALCCALFALVGAGSASAATHPLDTAIEQPDASLTDLRGAYKRIKGAGADYVRIVLYWDSVQPSRTSYNWTEPDKQINEAIAAGLTPLVTVWRAPGWAERSTKGEAGTRDPDPVAFGDFARQLALRYRNVHYWEAWNEPNLDHFLSPQMRHRHRYSPGLYRHLLDQFWLGVHSVDANAHVAAGGLARRYKIPPLQFIRDVFCLNDRLKAVGSCPVHLDAWSHHPYTNGGPFKKQGSPDGVSMGDLPRMRKTSPRPRLGNALPRRVHSVLDLRSSAGTPTDLIPTPFRWRCMRAGSPSALPGLALRGQRSSSGISCATGPSPRRSTSRPLLLLEQVRRGDDSEQPLCAEPASTRRTSRRPTSLHAFKFPVRRLCARTGALRSGGGLPTAPPQVPDPAAGQRQQRAR